MDSAQTPETFHATTVCIEGQGVMILGASGAGKSSLALQLIALGASLVADDRTILTPHEDHLIATCPSSIQGQIEARGVGILTLPYVAQTAVALVVDLDKQEPERLPHSHCCDLLGRSLPCLWRVAESHFASAILLWLKSEIGHTS